MRIKVTKQRNHCWYNVFIGSEFEVTKDERDYYTVSHNGDNDVCVVNKEDCEVVTEPQYLTKEEALCLCIHGTKVMSADTNASTEHYMDFNGIHFEWHHGKHKGIVNSMPTKFKLWEPPKPKFTVDSFVVFEEDYVKIIAAEYKHGSHRYYVSKGTYVNCKEDCIVADESELSAV